MRTHAQRMVVVIGLLSVVATMSGCTVGKQAYYEWRGARGEVLLNSTLTRGALEKYNSIEFEPAVTTLRPDLCPPSVKRYYDICAEDVSAGLLDAFPGGEPTLRIHSEIQYFQGKVLLDAGLCVARVRFEDDHGLVADAIVRADSQSFRAGDEEALAQAVAQAIGVFLRREKLGDVVEPEQGEQDDSTKVAGGQDDPDSDG